MTREELVKELVKGEKDVCGLLRRFVYMCDSKEDIIRLLIEYDYALYCAKERGEDYLDDVISELKDCWELEEEA